MNNAYSNIPLTEGSQIGGVFGFIMAPKEWIDQDVVVDFSTGKVLTEVTLMGDYSFLEARCVDDSMDLQQQEKEKRGVKYYELSLSGRVNTNTAVVQQILTTYWYHEWVIIYTNKSGVKKIIGNNSFGMKFTSTFKELSRQGGSAVFDIDLFMQSEVPALIYEV